MLIQPDNNEKLSRGNALTEMEGVDGNEQHHPGRPAVNEKVISAQKNGNEFSQCNLMATCRILPAF